MLRCRGGSEPGGKRGKSRAGGVGEVVDEGGELTGEGRSNLYWGTPLLLAFAILPVWPAGPHWPLPQHQIESKYLPPSDWLNPRRAGSSLVEAPSVG